MTMTEVYKTLTFEHNRESETVALFRGIICTFDQAFGAWYDGYTGFLSEISSDLRMKLVA